MTSWSIRRGTDLVPIPWRNGLGTTRDVITVLAPGGTLRWQVSIADLVQDAPFSHFPHCDRVFTPIAGDPPPELAFDGGPFEPCPLLVPKPFPGEVPTLSRIPAPGRAFNVVVDRRHVRAEVEIVREDRVVPPGGITVVYCHAGRLMADGTPLEPGDSLVRDGAGPAFSLAGPATSILVRVSPLPGDQR